MTPNDTLPPKQVVARALLERAAVFVHLDPRREGVRVPNWFKRQPSLVLQVGYQMAVPIVDLNFDDDGMSCTLSFNRSPHFCVVPWSSVYALVGDGGAMVWPDDIPPEVAAQVEGQVQGAAKPQLRAVKAPGDEPTKIAKSEAATEAVDDSAGAEREEKKPTRPSLRAVDAGVDAAEPESGEPAQTATEAEAETTGAEGEGKASGAKAGPAKSRARGRKGPRRLEPASTKELESAKELESQPEESPEDSAASDKPKRRELPPYLRIIK